MKRFRLLPPCQFAEAVPAQATVARLAAPTRTRREKRMNKTFPLLVISLLLLLCPVLAMGQATASSSAVTGIVTDPAGAVIPGVSVKLTDTKTGQERTATT